MTFKLPSEYPPELPVTIAARIQHTAKNMEVGAGILLGPSLLKKLTSFVTARDNTLDIDTSISEIGFSFIDCDDKPQALTFLCPQDELAAQLETLSITLHVFYHLGVKSVIIFDGIRIINDADSVIYRIDDHVNMTGINPLKYWMLPGEPESFFLDVKNLYASEGLDHLDGIIHMATLNDEKIPFEDQACATGIGSFGRAVLPEALIASYLGMKVKAVGISLDRQKIDMITVGNEILTLIKKCS